MADKLYIDFEAFSQVDIEKEGGLKYSRHESTNMVCMGYAFDNEEVCLITALESLPNRIREHVEDGGKVYAHNIAFDFRIWNGFCVNELGWPTLSLDQCVDTMALCLTFQIPPKLFDAGRALQVKVLKQVDGKKLIKACCTPNKAGRQPDPGGPTHNLFDRLYAYCKDDIGSMRCIVDTLPRDALIPTEHELWKLTYEMNTLGLPVDLEAIKAIKERVASYVEIAMNEVPMLTGGFANTINQIQKVRDWAAMQGYPMDSLSADAVKKALDDENCPNNVREILQLRQELGRSSTAKYTKLSALATYNESDGYWYVHDNLQYHGAGTGRWAGRGFQVHNLPRASVKDPEEQIRLFIEGGYVEDPVFKAKALIRPMIKAIDDHELLVSDYSSIENRVLHWLADDYETLDEFAAGLDQYCTMAAARYHLTYDEIRNGHKAKIKEYSAMRQMGKVIILGCGFGMGAEKFVDTADVQFNMKISLDEAKMAVSAYREKYDKVVALWRNLKTGMCKAILTGQKVTVGRITMATARVKGRLWLAMRLPSGKCIYYMEPRVEQRYVPGYESMGKVATVTHMGMNPRTRQWNRIALIPGRITENAVQGTARECMGCGMLNVRDRMPFVRQLASVHDELISMVHKMYVQEGLLEEYNRNLCDVPWADGLPLKAEGWIGPRYRKE